MKRALILCLIVSGLFVRPALANDTVYYYHTDAQGTAVVVTDANHNVVERTYYGPYGEVLNRPLRDGPGYTGHEEDAATGLDNMQQRYYDPVSGRFPSPDSMEVDTSTGSNFNRYAYANDNPYRYTDPDGRQTADTAKIEKKLKDDKRHNQRSREAQVQTGSHIPGNTGSGNVRVIQVNPAPGSVVYKAGVPPASSAVSNMLTCTASCTGDTVRVTSTSDSHGPNDPHTRGLAADVTTGDAPRLMQCAANCGARYQQNEYVHPSPNATGGHVHLQLVPGRGGATGPYYPEPAQILSPHADSSGG